MIPFQSAYLRSKSFSPIRSYLLNNQKFSKNRLYIESSIDSKFKTAFHAQGVSQRFDLHMSHSYNKLFQ